MAAEVLQELDLAQGALGQDLLAEHIGDLLDGDALVRLVVHGGAVIEGVVSAISRASQEEGQFWGWAGRGNLHLGGRHTKQYRRRPGQALWSRYIARRR